MEQISVFDIFKIGVGPSSSHTLGPWKAALRCLQEAEDKKNLEKISHLSVELYGSLAKTGKGHGTDIALLMGLRGDDPVTVEISSIHEQEKIIRKTKKILLLGKKEIDFDPDKDISFFHDKSLPFHPNALKFIFTLSNGVPHSETWYSIGGGFVLREGEEPGSRVQSSLPHPINLAEDLLKWCREKNFSVSQLVMENEKVWRTPEQTRKDLLTIWNTMLECIYRGCHTEGTLPGGLNVVRRAFHLNKKLLGNDASYSDATSWMKAIKSTRPTFQDVLKWVSCFALAVNEENASFGRVVTAPTNGAAGVIPAVLMYYLCFCDNKGDDDIVKFLLTAGELGSIFKKGSTISAAMGGCQAEIGVSSAMAAGALNECMGGSPERVLMTAEIAMEHHLGLTCDPIGGLVQIPCIERNSMGAVKAITASQLAMESDPSQAKVSLDNVIKTMWDTARDMNHKYKETSDGGLAVNIPVNLIDC